MSDHRSQYRAEQVPVFQNRMLSTEAAARRWTR